MQSQIHPEITGGERERKKKGERERMKLGCRHVKQNSRKDSRVESYKDQIQESVENRSGIGTSSFSFLTGHRVSCASLPLWVFDIVCISWSTMSFPSLVYNNPKYLSQYLFFFHIL